MFLSLLLLFVSSFVSPNSPNNKSSNDKSPKSNESPNVSLLRICELLPLLFIICSLVLNSVNCVSLFLLSSILLLLLLLRSDNNELDSFKIGSRGGGFGKLRGGGLGFTLFGRYLGSGSFIRLFII